MATIFIDLQERDRSYRLSLWDEASELRRRNGWSAAAIARALTAFARNAPLVDSDADQLRFWEIFLELYHGVDGFVSPRASEALIVAVRSDLRLADDILRWSAPPELNRDAVLLFATQHAADYQPLPAAPNHDVDERELAAVVGILERERRTDPGSDGLRFYKALAGARGEYQHHENDSARLFEHVLELLIAEGDHRAHDRVSAEHWAGIVDALSGEGITGDNIYLQMRVREALKGRAGDSGGGAGGSAPPHFPGASKPSWIDISLPNLESQVDTEIVADNLKAMQALFFASVLEEGKFFQVMDRVLEQFNTGVIPLGKGTAGDKLYTYYKRNFDRFTEIERRNLYARAFGTPGGEAIQGNPNRSFPDLFFRFISSVSEYSRQLEVDSLLKARNAVSLSQEQVRKSARDLAANLSLYGYGVAYFAATELQQQIRDVIDILNDDEIKGAYGARDLWQVIDQVATLDLGGARNSVRYRTMANSGAIIIRWLADHADDISQAGRGRIFSDADLLGTAQQAPTNPLVSPSTRDLIDACEQYLAVTGTSDMRVEEYSQPTLSPDGQTSRPIQIPNVARDLLESAGISGIGVN